MNAFQSLKQLYHRVTARVVGVILRPGAAYVPGNFELWQRRGYHILPLHFYSPVPDTRVLRTSDLWTGDDPMLGIDWNLACQIDHLVNCFPPFGNEFATEVSGGLLNAYGFARDNDAFVGVDPAALYAFVRYYRPNLVLEIGSGHSSRVVAAALDHNCGGELVSVDPYPNEQLLADLSGAAHTLVKSQVQQLPADTFDRLAAGDVLFIDSTHTVRTGGDVTFLFQQVLPRLRSGVIVHFHDIFLPHDYPREWVLDKHIFWTEQYLLHAFLMFNSAFEILMANHLLGMHHAGLLKECFPASYPWYSGGSFWIRRTSNDTKETQ